jgi:hypothetical protein
VNLTKIILVKLHSLGLYGSQSISIHALRTGIKGYSLQEFEDCIIALFMRGLIIISNSSGKPGISLNPKKIEEIETLIR